MSAAALPPADRLRIVILGLSITSSWGNGHATTYRGLVRALCRRGRQVLFLERDAPWYRDTRDLPQPPFGTTRLYNSVTELRERWSGALRDADLAIVGSYVPDGIAVAELVLRTAGGLIAFYDIDTPVTLAALAAERCEYLTPKLIPGFDLYLSFTGGPLLRRIEDEFGARAARALLLGRSGLPSSGRGAARMGPRLSRHLQADRQLTLDRLIRTPARGWPQGRFAIAGSLFGLSVSSSWGNGHGCCGGR